MIASNEPNLILMVKSHGFGWNEETAQSNAFQVKNDSIDAKLAMIEFDRVLTTLTENGIKVTCFEDHDLSRPDSIFPNNWIAQVPGQGIWTFPMMALNRRREVRPDILETMRKATGELIVNQLIPIGETDFLEGTGSIIFNHRAKTAYACISPRTSVKLFEKFCGIIGYDAVSFLATDALDKAIYHTNVMLSISDSLAILCADAIADSLERAMLIARLKSEGLEILEISLSQMNSYAANVLAVRNTGNERLMIISQVAWNSLNPNQQDVISAHFDSNVTVEIDTIEAIGGGGIRCMMAGFFSKLI